jgi:hypothetical protein
MRLRTEGQKSSGELTALKSAWLVREGAVGNVPRGNALAAYFTYGSAERAESQTAQSGSVQHLKLDHAIALLEAEQRWLDDIISFPGLTAGAVLIEHRELDSYEGRPQALQYIIGLFPSTKKDCQAFLYEEIMQSSHWQSYDHVELYAQRDLIVACLDVLAEQIADELAGDLIRIVVQDSIRVILAAELAWLERSVTASDLYPVNHDHYHNAC